MVIIETTTATVLANSQKAIELLPSLCFCGARLEQPGMHWLDQQTSSH